MAKVKVLARGWKLDINTGTIAVPIWTPVKGIKSFTFSNGKNDVDTTDFDSAGAEEHMVASRNQSIKVDGNFLEDLADKSRDPGQAAVESLGNQIGSSSLGQFRLTTPAGTTKIFMASVGIGDIGGGNDDNTSWGCELTRSGATADSSLPAAPFIIAAICAEGGAAEGGFGAGDTLTLVFNVPTNKAPGTSYANKAAVDAILTFSASFGTDYSGSWKDAQTLVITSVTPAGFAFAVGGTVTVLAGANIKTLDGLSAASVCTSPASIGTFT